jgi:hypothetical protein
VIRPGFIGVTQKPNSDHFSGRAYCLHAQKDKANLLNAVMHFFYNCAVVHYAFALQGQTVNLHYYIHT